MDCEDFKTISWQRLLTRSLRESCLMHSRVGPVDFYTNFIKSSSSVYILLQAQAHCLFLSLFQSIYERRTFAKKFLKQLKLVEIYHHLSVYAQ